MKNHNKLIVSLKVAKLARQVGFDEKCDWAYCFDTLKEAYYENYDPDSHQNSKLWERHYAAPTSEELNNWLRQRNIFVSVDIDQTYEPKFAYKVRQYQENGNWDVLSGTWSDLYYRYEQALEDGLNEGLEKLL